MLLITFQRAPHWRNELGKELIDPDSEIAKEARSVEIPSRDPVNGGDNGPLIQLWMEARRQGGMTRE
jgi:hypothetical protein